MSKSKDKIGIYERIHVANRIADLEQQVEELLEALRMVYDELKVVVSKYKPPESRAQSLALGKAVLTKHVEKPK